MYRDRDGKISLRKVYTY